MKMEAKVRFDGDIRQWDDIPVSMCTRDLTPEERSDFLRKMREFSKSQLVLGVRVHETGSHNGIYFDNQILDASYFRGIEPVELTRN